MVKVYVSIEDKEKTELGQYQDQAEAFEAITKDIESNGFESFYWRINTLEDGSLWLDYGSHTRFYIIENLKLF